jgi:hypothetical protein
VIVVTAAEVRSLGSFDAIQAFLATAELNLAPLAIIDDGEAK